MIHSVVFVAAVALQEKYISSLQQIFQEIRGTCQILIHSTCFVDLGKVYGRVPRGKLRVMLCEYGVHGYLLLAVK